MTASALYTVASLAPGEPGIRFAPVYVPGDAVERGCPDLGDWTRAAVLGLEPGECLHVGQERGPALCIRRER